MIQFHILSGRQAGNDIVVRRFPFRVGRSGGVDFALDEAGVWHRHVQFDFRKGEGFTFAGNPDATILVNGEAAGGGVLRPGDLLQLGSIRLRFWLAPAAQRCPRWREVLVWAALAALFAGQAWLIHWLRR